LKNSRPHRVFRAELALPATTDRIAADIARWFRAKYGELLPKRVKSVISPPGTLRTFNSIPE
jgi:hypothetical protein